MVEQLCVDCRTRPAIWQHKDDDEPSFCQICYLPYRCAGGWGWDEKWKLMSSKSPACKDGMHDACRWCPDYKECKCECHG